MFYVAYIHLYMSELAEQIVFEVGFLPTEFKFSISS